MENKRLSHFNISWKEKEEYCQWLCEGRSNTEAKCTLCDCYFSVGNGGISQVQQHASGVRHASKITATTGQKKLQFNSAGIVTLESGSGMRFNHDEQVMRAEVILLFRLVKYNHSFSSQEDLTETLKYIFPNNDIVKDLSLASTKSSYSIAYGLGPHYHAELVEDIKRSYYSLIVDETTTQQNIKQLDLHIRYWSLTEHKISARYLNSCFLGHATADVMKDNIVKCLSDDGLSLTKMIMLSTDGPNVNKSLRNKLIDAQKDLGCPPLVDVGSCNLHTIHNSFKAGVNSVSHWSVEEFLTDIFYYFKNFPSRQEDYRELCATFNGEDSIRKFTRFVESRWLSMSPVTVRILENWECLCQYFLHGKFDSQNEKKFTI